MKHTRGIYIYEAYKKYIYMKHTRSIYEAYKKYI